MALHDPERCERPKPSKKRRRRDLYQDIRQYYGEPVLGSKEGGRVPTLFDLTILCVIRGNIPFEKCPIPAAMCKILQTHKQYESWIGPKVIKCSECGKLYTDQELFEKHICEMFYGNPHV